ncbi:MAG: ACT domain protein [Thermoplasmatales archaeon]|nr:ACT domain protein [Thermoplasmatales archaeon]
MDSETGMKNWEFDKVRDKTVKLDNALADMMGLVDGGYIYSTLFEYDNESPKKYELILSTYPQENYRTLTNITMYIQDVPGSSAQAARFLGDRDINILNSISLEGISDTIIIWKMLVDLNFAGEVSILTEKFAELKERNDPSVSKIDHIQIKPADIGRVFRTEGRSDKIEIRRGVPITLKDNTYDLSVEYSDIFEDFEGESVMVAADYASWIVSISFFKGETKLVRIGLEIPDCPGSITQVLDWIATKNVNLISVFSKIKICYQTMTLDLVADFSGCRMSMDEFRISLEDALEDMNGIFVLTQYEELK